MLLGISKATFDHRATKPQDGFRRRSAHVRLVGVQQLFPFVPFDRATLLGVADATLALRTDATVLRGTVKPISDHGLKEGKRVPMTAAASRWLTDVYDKVMNLRPTELASRLSPAEMFHEVLEHRWFLSEKAGRDVGTTAAARSYFDTCCRPSRSTSWRCPLWK